jgi:hypothetical protein
MSYILHNYMNLCLLWSDVVIIFLASKYCIFYISALLLLLLYVNNLS